MYIYIFVYIYIYRFTPPMPCVDTDEIAGDLSLPMSHKIQSASTTFLNHNLAFWLKQLS